MVFFGKLRYGTTFCELEAEPKRRKVLPTWSQFATQGEECLHHEKTLNPRRDGVDDKATRDTKHCVMTTRNPHNQAENQESNFLSEARCYSELIL